MPRQIEVVNEDERLAIDTTAVQELLHFLDSHISDWCLPPGDLTVAFVSPRRCRELHETFFSDPGITDVMTFPGDPEDDYAGDLAICPSHASTQAPEFGSSFSEELTLYILHGWLHLAGLDDRSEKDRSRMRQAEKTLQAITGKAGYRLKAAYND